jgi:signal peptidase II
MAADETAATTTAPGSSKAPATAGRLARLTAFIWKNKIPWLLAIVVFGVGLDQGTKLYFFDKLTRAATPEEIACSEPGARRGGGECRGMPRVTAHGQRVVTNEIVVVPGFFHFKYAENPAAAFSMTGSLPTSFRRPFLLSISLIASLGLLVWFLLIKQPDWAILTAFPMIIAGAVGNLIDRARLAYVIDFLDMYVSHSAAAGWMIRQFGSNHWPTYNVADSFIVVGAALVIFRTLRPVPGELVDDAPLAAPARGDAAGSAA